MADHLYEAHCKRSARLRTPAKGLSLPTTHIEENCEAAPPTCPIIGSDGLEAAGRPRVVGESEFDRVARAVVRVVPKVPKRDTRRRARCPGLARKVSRRRVHSE